MGKAIVGLLALVLLLFAACGSTTPSTPAAQAQFCQSLTNLGSTVDQLQQVNGNTSIGEVKSSGQAVAAALAQVQQSAAYLHDARVSDLNASVDNLQHTINNLSSSTTLSEAAQTIQSQAADVQSARAQVGSQAGCGTATATP